MGISKLPDGRYLVDLRPSGSEGKRIRKKFITKGEAKDFEWWAIAKYTNKEWVEPVKDDRYLHELIELWWKLKGQLLRDGTAIYGKLLAMDRRLGHPAASDITPKLFAEYRAQRTSAGIKPKTINTEQTHLSSMFNSLHESGHYPTRSPLTGVRRIKLTKSEMGYLTKEQIVQLLAQLDGDNVLAVKLCLATGARWNEAASLTSSQLLDDRVTYIKTKNGNNRTVPVSPELIASIRKGKDHNLFPDVDYITVRNTIKSIAPNLPDGQATHVLRHTFASHFMMNGGNILALQRILGHANILQTMVYAHFAPDYLFEAVKFNPVAAL
ncbi:tyrosine-type recombinase/integrase [Salmonella enterica subsp. enterica]|nr:integrase [Salmonella enterica subsp. enterica serovar Richmond]EDH6551537.1 integrase [Salmonella enterica subsp. enterica serovar Richmond]EDS3170798.1 tyrosine-type recombinase/integrase [Salmonella enterica subsp. enterica serovar Richmond]EHX1589835.1 tyrosine-type recombinase/integrase [Salmonella enterica subsp. enterica serovar Richmond]